MKEIQHIVDALSLEGYELPIQTTTGVTCPYCGLFIDNLVDDDCVKEMCNHIRECEENDVY